MNATYFSENKKIDKIEKYFVFQGESIIHTLIT